MANNTHLMDVNKTVLTNISCSMIEAQSKHCMTSSILKKMLSLMFIVIIILSLMLNSTLWITYAVRPHIRSKATAYMISLSISDFITAVTLGWLEVYYVLHYPYWSFGEIGTMLLNSFWCFSLVTPFVHITVMTYDRYRAVMSRVGYLATRRWKIEFSKILFIWLYSIGVVLLMAFYFSPAPGYVYQWNVMPEWYYPFLAIHIALPLVICSALYIKIMFYIKQQRKQINRLSAGLTQEVNYAKSIAGIIISLYIVWLPVIGMEIIYGVKAYTCSVTVFGILSVWLTCTSGVINPLVFLSKHESFRLAIRSLFGKTGNSRFCEANTKSESTKTMPRRKKSSDFNFETKSISMLESKTNAGFDIEETMNV